MTEIQVKRDPAGSAVELRIESTAGGETTVIRLSPDEARRLAALVLFQASKQDRPASDRILAFPDRSLKSA
jgi:hypothetical protein